MLTELDALLINERPFVHLPDIPSVARYVAASKSKGVIPRLTSDQAEVFDRLWSQGEFLVVVLQEAVNPVWSPDTLALLYGKQLIDVNCMDSKGANTIESMSVAEFFALFRKPTSDGSSYRVKDWPTSATFSSTWTHENVSFEKALPFLAFTSSRGSFNLPAHFARSLTNVAAHPPDLGWFRF